MGAEPRSWRPGWHRLAIASTLWTPLPAHAASLAGGEPIASAVAPESRAEALTCLAQAISYEAGNEPEEGQEAVAQVVLNRLHDGAYPKTVCRVVFQGSERRTGCQFTFTCDGSLERRRPGASWANALRIAGLALDGRLVSPVGDATHYHAYYVSPAWAAQLTRIGRIGAHIFYGGAPSGGARIALWREASRGTVPTPKTASFAVWGLETAVLTPTHGSIAIRSAAAAPDGFGEPATPPSAPDKAGPASR